MLEIESVRNGVTIIDKTEHDKKYNITKKLYSDLENMLVMLIVTVQWKNGI